MIKWAKGAIIFIFNRFSFYISLCKQMAKRRETPNIQKATNDFEMQLIFKPEQGDISPISSLPPETITYMFSFLDVPEIRIAAQVCSKWNNLANENTVWKEYCLRDWNFTTQLASNWKSTYQILKEVFSESIWEGMSKWVDPPGYDAEQKTTIKLHFMKKNQEKALPIVGSGVTINCKVPSPFKIDGFRSLTDSSAVSYTWKKVFDKHTSHYAGVMDVLKQKVTGTILYNDGKTEWKGEFAYTRSPTKKGKERSVIA